MAFAWIGSSTITSNSASNVQRVRRPRGHHGAMGYAKSQRALAEFDELLRMGPESTVASARLSADCAASVSNANCARSTCVQTPRPPIWGGRFARLFRHSER